MSHISYFSLLKKKLDVVYEEKVLGRLLSFAFDAATGNICNVLYMTSASKRKHTLKGVHVLSIEPTFEVELATADGQVELWIPKEQKVVTESGIYLGKVHDVLFDQAFMKLSHIDAVQKILFFPVRSHLISRDAIVELKKNKVIVKDVAIMEQGTSLAFQKSQLPVMETTTQSHSYEHS